MKIRHSRTALAILTAATLALPAALANAADAAKCAPKTQGMKCAGKCAPKCAAKCAAGKCKPKCAPMGKCAGKCKPKCAPAK
jgi:hypothetical protein